MEIDVEQVAAVAVELEKCAARLTDIADAAAALAFDADSAGRNYGDLGARIGAGYAGVEAVFRRWSEASMDNTVRLRSSIAAYTSADASTAESLYGAGPR